MSAAPPMLSEAVQVLPEKLILPQLIASDLGRLACTCSQMRRWLAQVDPGIWRVAATSRLPRSHFALSNASLAAVRQALRFYIRSCKNICRGWQTLILTLGTVVKLKIRPLAAILRRYPNRPLDSMMVFSECAVAAPIWQDMSCYSRFDLSGLLILLMQMWHSRPMSSG